MKHARGELGKRGGECLELHPPKTPRLLHGKVESLAQQSRRQVAGQVLEGKRTSSFLGPERARRSLGFTNRLLSKRLIETGQYGRQPCDSPVRGAVRARDSERIGQKLSREMRRRRRQALRLNNLIRSRLDRRQRLRRSPVPDESRSQARDCFTLREPERDRLRQVNRGLQEGFRQVQRRAGQGGRLLALAVNLLDHGQGFLQCLLLTRRIERRGELGQGFRAFFRNGNLSRDGQRFVRLPERRKAKGKRRQLARSMILKQNGGRFGQDPPEQSFRQTGRQRRKRPHAIAGNPIVNAAGQVDRLVQ